MRGAHGMPERVNFRAHASEKECFEDAARQLGLSLAEFARRALLEAAEKLAA